MRKAGCYRLNLAYESGSQEVLDTIIKKPVKLERDLPKLRVARKLDFEIIGYFVIGLPGETPQQLKQTLDVASNPDFDYVTLSIATPQKGTKLEETCFDEELIDEKTVLADISRRSTGFFESEKLSIKDLEEIRWGEWDRINFRTPDRRKRVEMMMGISEEELEEMRQNTEKNFKERWQKIT